MAYTFAELIDQAQSALGDNTTTFTDAIVTVQLEDAFREVSEYEPYVVMHSFKLESRTGSDTAGTTDKLTDDSNDQFVAADVGKAVYNTTDKTWAVVTAFDDVDVLSISKDIMASGEEYKLFNKGCWTNKQINISDVFDYIGPGHGVIAVEYKTLKKPRDYRNFTVEGDILSVDIDDSPPDSKVATSGDQPDVEVFVWFNKRHRVTQLTDLPGTINGTPAAGATSVTFANFSGAEVMLAGTLFTIAGVRGTYMITTSKALSSGGGTFTCWPDLESAAVNLAVVNIISTLNSRLERLVVDLASARLGMAKFANSISKGGQVVYNRYESKLGIVLAELRSGQKPETSRVWPKD